jgi:hypothetical protein
MAVAQALAENVVLHIVFSFSSGILLGIAGGVVLSRDRTSRLNQMFLGFFVGIGGHQLLDGVMTYFLIGLNDLGLASLFRDLSLAFLIIGLSFGALVALNLYYGQSVMKSNYLIIWGAFTLLLVIGGLVGDTVLLGGYYGDIPSKTRDTLGWIGITGSLVIFSLIIIGFLVLLIRGVVDKTVQQKIIGIITGFTLINVVVFFFDIAFVVPLFQEIISTPLLHFLAHLIALIGGFINVAVLWSPMRS